MAVTRKAAKTATKTATAARRPDPFTTFVWEGNDKRGVKMKGEQAAKSANLLRAELRRQGITPTVVKEKTKPLFGGAGKRISAKDSLGWFMIATAVSQNRSRTVPLRGFSHGKPIRLTGPFSSSPFAK